MVIWLIFLILFYFFPSFLIFSVFRLVFFWGGGGNTTSPSAPAPVQVPIAWSPVIHCQDISFTENYKPHVVRLRLTTGSCWPFLQKILTVYYSQVINLTRETIIVQQRNLYKTSFLPRSFTMWLIRCFVYYCTTY